MLRILTISVSIGRIPSQVDDRLSRGSNASALLSNRGRCRGGVVCRTARSLTRLSPCTLRKVAFDAVTIFLGEGDKMLVFAALLQSIDYSGDLNVRPQMGTGASLAVMSETTETAVLNTGEFQRA